MALLNNAQRREVEKQINNDLSNRRDPCAINRQVLRDAINAADQWAEDNRTSYNNALPLEARTGLTNKQKSEVLVLVIKRRYEAE